MISVSTSGAFISWVINSKCFDLENEALSWSSELYDGVEDDFGKNFVWTLFLYLLRLDCFWNFLVVCICVLMFVCVHLCEGIWTCVFMYVDILNYQFPQLCSTLSLRWCLSLMWSLLIWLTWLTIEPQTSSSPSLPRPEIMGICFHA